MKNKRILIITRVDVSQDSNYGVVTKYNQIKNSLIRLSFDVDHVTYKKGSVQFNGKKIWGGKVPRILSKWLFFRKLITEIKIESYDILLIRYGMSNKPFIDFLEWAKFKNAKVKIILDMPTYPYQKEWSGVKGRIVTFVDKQFSGKLVNCVDLILHSGPEPQIHMVPTLQMTNGIDASQYPIINGHQYPNQINMIAVAKWQKWHGLERLLEGLFLLKRRKSTPKLMLNIVGDGPYLSRIEKSISKKSLKDIVVLHGPLIGVELDNLFSDCQLAIGTLGIHTKDVAINSSLKHREYAARGIPFILSSPDPDFPSELPFVKYVEVSNDPIDIESIIAFCRTLSLNSTRHELREYSENHLAWDQKLLGLIQLLSRQN